MKRIALTLLKIVGFIFFLFLGVYFLFKSITIDNLQDKLLLVNKSWTEVTSVQKKNLELLDVLLQDIEQEMQYSDSLRTKLVELQTDSMVDYECNSELIYEQYLVNKYMLPFLNNYSESDSVVNVRNKEVIKQIKVNIDDLNKKVEVYNELVDEYNLYRSNLLVVLIARSRGFDYKKLFEIRYGIENKDPKEVLRERREWQMKLEEQYGLDNLG